MSQYYAVNGPVAGEWLEDVNGNGAMVVMERPTTSVRWTEGEVVGEAHTFREVLYRLRQVQLPGWRIRLSVWVTGREGGTVQDGMAFPGYVQGERYPSTRVAYGAKWFRNIRRGCWDLAYPDPGHERGYDPDQIEGAVSMELLHKHPDTVHAAVAGRGWPDLPREAFGVDTRPPVPMRVMTPDEVMALLMSGNTAPNPGVDHG